MPIILNILKRRAIKTYLRKLPKLLVKDYSRLESYTPKQIISTIERYKLPRAYIIHAIAIFSNRDGFEEHYKKTDKNHDYNTVRGEVSDRHFDGYNFSMSDIMSKYKHSTSAGNTESDNGD